MCKDKNETQLFYYVEFRHGLDKYLLLLFSILNKYNITASIGPIFKYRAQNHQQDFVAEQIWPYIKDLGCN